MRLDRGTLTQLGSGVLFIGLSLALIRAPFWGPLLFPGFAAIFLWSEFRREQDFPVILFFLVSAAGAVLITNDKDFTNKAVLSAGVAGLWALSFGLSLHRDAARQDQRELDAEKQTLSVKKRDDDRELHYYRQYSQSASEQIRARRELAESARSLSSTMDAREVHQRLLTILEKRYEGSRASVSAGAADPLLDWAARKKGPVLLRDSRTDERFKGQPAAFRSGVAVPMTVMHQQAGLLKLESDKPDAFTADDVKTVDLLATLAALSLENIQFYEQVNIQATHDALTQLHSHRSFQSRLQDEVLRSGRAQTPLSLIMCDVDHFKRYNDQYGHQAGDHLLRTLAAVLASFARPVDLVARYGGEEFAIILPNFVRTEAVDLANRIRLRVAGEPFVFQGKNTNATMSFGVASFPQDATTASQIVRAADERLYRAKHGGRNQVIG